MVWGGMIALSTIVDLKHYEIFSNLQTIIDTVKKGSVITIDCGVIIFAHLTKYGEYFSMTNTLLMEQLNICPIKQLPMYAERSLICIDEKNESEFVSIINRRITECTKESQKVRLIKVLKKIAE